MTNIEHELQTTVLNNFIDKTKYTADGNLSATLVLNESEQVNVYRVLKMELATCTSFTFAVAFITESGLTSFLTVLADLKKRGIHGRILTSTYLYFNKPEIFRTLMNIENIETRIFTEKDPNSTEPVPFHAKGYLFDHGKYHSAIIGSSNLTDNALIKNYEWNMCINSLDNAEITETIKLQIEDEWNKATPLTKKWYKDYQVKHREYIEKHGKMYVAKTTDSDVIEPNKMQLEALAQLKSLRQKKVKKALIVSATGTGKTYLGAFDVKEFKPRRFLFVAHREQILKKSCDSFQKVLGGNKDDYGIISGTQHNVKAKYVFATVQTLAKDDFLNQFKPDYFDYILFDEAHHLGAKQHQKVFNYFTPEFCLGMTATPERTDDFNIYKLFDYQVAYEIRLQDALYENMLCPFHYYGVEDYIYNDHIINGATSLERLVSSERVDYIIQQTKYYSYSGDILHGLIFCSRTDEAKNLADALSNKGYPAKALSGADSIKTRDATVKELELGKIKYIVTVDVFNEGIDIPCINQVVLLRNTQSSIVFIQQLGRGLRKYPGKDYLTVIDFIGDYDNNYLIPIALSGDKSHNTDHVKDELGLDPICGVSIINFTNVARTQIYKSINNSKLTQKKRLREEYLNEKRRLGRIPLMADLQEHSIDCEVISTKYKNYNKFLLEMGEKGYQLNDYQNKVLEFITVVLANGKRKQELLLLNELLNGNSISEAEFEALLNANGCLVSENILNSINQVLSLKFFERKSFPNKESYGNKPLVEYREKQYYLNKNLKAEFQNRDFLILVRDAINTGLIRSKKYHSDQLFTVNKRYTRVDANRLLNWDHIISGQIIGGYKFDNNQKNCAIFITYNKNKDAQTISYPDKFISPSLIRMYSKSQRKLESKEINKFKNKDISFYLFIKKSDDDGKSFIYLGKCRPQANSFRQEFIEKTDKDNNVKKVPVVSMNLKLDTPVSLNEYYMLTKMRY